MRFAFMYWAAFTLSLVVTLAAWLVLSPLAGGMPALVVVAILACLGAGTLVMLPFTDAICEIRP
jgi:hypothetical protein